MWIRNILFFSVWNGDHGWTSYCLRINGPVWWPCRYWGWSMLAHYHPIVCCRSHRPATWWTSPKRIWSRVWNFTLHRYQCLRNNRVESFQSGHRKHWSWNWIRGSCNCSFPSFGNPSRQGLWTLAIIISIIQAIVKFKFFDDHVGSRASWGFLQTKPSKLDELDGNRTYLCSGHIFPSIEFIHHMLTYNCQICKIIQWYIFLGIPCRSANQICKISWTIQQLPHQIVLYLKHPNYFAVCFGLQFIRHFSDARS